jgi:hypothetical protein
MKKFNLAPIILFVYNRFDILSEVINSIKNNKLSKKSELHIFSDGFKNASDKIKVLKIRLYLKKIKGFKKVYIYERKKNFGLSNNIVNGITQILEKYDKAIIVEDDIFVSRYFLSYMNQALNIYKYDLNVASIHGYQYPIFFPKKFPETFFIKGADCWGWGTWKRAWKIFEKDAFKLYLKIKSDSRLVNEFNYDNSYNFLKMLLKESQKKIDSWDIKWYASAFLKNMYTLYPKKSLVKNLGFDKNSTHTNNFFFYNSRINHSIKKLDRVEIEENLLFRSKVMSFFKERKILRFISFFKFKILQYIKLVK